MIIDQAADCCCCYVACGLWFVCSLLMRIMSVIAMHKFELLLWQVDDVEPLIPASTAVADVDPADAKSFDAKRDLTCTCDLSPFTPVSFGLDLAH